jgi:two-component system sensor kinase FixL
VTASKGAKFSQSGATAPAEALRLADIVESSFDAIFSRSLDGVVTTWNAAAERIFGYPAREILGKSSEILLPPDRPEEQNEIIDRIRSGERVENFETVRLRKDGQSVAISMTVSPIRDRRRRIVGAATIARDITMQRELQAEILEIAERERRRMGRDLHDGLGQQLTGMELLCRTLARSLEKRGLPEASTAQLLVTHLANTIEQTRSLARGLVPVIDRPNGLMLALEDFARAVSTLYNVRCIFLCSEPVLIEEHHAAVHLYRIAQEAVSNAVRHGKARRVTISLRHTDEEIWLTVRDNGHGFKPDTVASTGLGLHIMGYRAAIVGASFDIEPAAPRGIKVVCHLHVPHTGAARVKAR